MSATTCQRHTRTHESKSSRGRGGPRQRAAVQWFKGARHWHTWRPVRSSRFSGGPGDTLITLSNRYARPCRPWKAFEMIALWSARWAWQQEQQYTTSASTCDEVRTFTRFEDASCAARSSEAGSVERARFGQAWPRFHGKARAGVQALTCMRKMRPMGSHGQAERPSREAEQDEVRPSRVCGLPRRALQSVKNVPAT